MKLFDHPGCHSGQCAARSFLMASISADDVSDNNNYVELKTRVRELLREGRRLLDESDMHSVAPVDTSELDRQIAIEASKMDIPSQVIDGIDVNARLTELIRARREQTARVT